MERRAPRSDMDQALPLCPPGLPPGGGIPGEANFAAPTLTMYDAEGRILEKVIYWSVCGEETADAVARCRVETAQPWALGPRPEDECPALRDRYTYEVDETTSNSRKQTIHRWVPGHAAFEPFQVIYRTITSVGAP